MLSYTAPQRPPCLFTSSTRDVKRSRVNFLFYSKTCRMVKFELSSSGILEHKAQTTKSTARRRTQLYVLDGGAYCICKNCRRLAFPRGYKAPLSSRKHRCIRLISLIPFPSSTRKYAESSSCIEGDGRRGMEAPC